ncbi:MAG: protein translocase subunit SecDF [Alphaproteobacteria bacterium]|nr:MAG: protein translocase subunit SecDF [Alphaproteobacteria bacterium]
MLYFSRWKIISILAVIVLGFVYAAPNLLSKETREALPGGWAPHRAMTLGLDLQGGSHILLQVDEATLRAEKLETLQDDIRRILREARIGYRFARSGDNAVNVTIRETTDIASARDKLGELTRPVAGGLFGQASISEVAMNEPSSGVLRLTLTEEGIRNSMSHAVTQSLEVVRKRIDELGTTEPVVQRQGDDRVLVQVPGFDDPARLKDIIGQTAKLTFHLVSTEMSAEEALQGRPPAGTRILYEESDPPVPYLIESRAMVEGEDLVDAQPGFDQRTNEPIVTFRFDTRGATRFCQVTSANVGRPFAIVLDEQIISAPVIRDAICGGSGQISGNFTVESANDLAVLLRAGALPAKLDVIEERTVGPGLGADSIEAGKIASIVGGIAVIVFMLAIYGFLGVLANIALIANISLIVAVLSVLGATLTLPGIAGIVLTVGMAVDSNVLIYERVREERRNGRSLIQSFDAGFKQALATIIDANITTLIAAVILFYLGSGPIRGFAVTLAIGVITTVFTAYTFTRLMVALWVRYRRPTKLPARLFGILPEDTSLKFMRYRRIAFPVSGIVALASIVLFFTASLNYGIDFKGGTLIEVQSKAAVADVGDVRSRLAGLNIGEVQVQNFGSPADVLIRVESQGAGDSAEQSAEAKVRTALESDFDLRRVEVVGPTVSGELAQTGTIAVIVSLIAIMIYIWFRFEWQFSLGAVIATLHDVILTIGMFAVLRLDFSLSSIAAILTIVGYSLNDTVVVYDRIRENLRKYKKMPIPQLLDMSINQTLSRTILTSSTTLVALFSLYFLGGEVLSSFTFAMIFGIFVGTYSSIFVAAPVLILFNLRPGQVGALSSETAETVDAGSTEGI